MYSSSPRSERRVVPIEGGWVREFKADASSLRYDRRVVSIGGGRRRTFNIDCSSVWCICLVVSIGGGRCRKFKVDFDGGDDRKISDETSGSLVVLGSIVGAQ